MPCQCTRGAHKSPAGQGVLTEVLTYWALEAHVVQKDGGIRELWHLPKYSVGEKIEDSEMAEDKVERISKKIKKASKVWT